MATSGRKASRSGGIKPPLDPQYRENQIISAAMNLAERQIKEGTASSQIISHFLKLGTANARYETEKLINENELLKAKREQLQSQKSSEELYAKAIHAMGIYGGKGSSEDYEDDYDDYDDRY